jgi:hypothetical protein
MWRVWIDSISAFAQDHLPRLSWNHYIVTGFPYKITPQSLLILFQICVDTFSEADA